MAVPTLTPAFIIPEGIGGGISGGSGNVGATAAGVVAAGVIAGGLAVAAAPVVAGLAAKAGLLTAASPLGLLAVGTFLKGLEQLREWGLFNWRPPSLTGPIPDGGILQVSPTNVNMTVNYVTTQRWSARKYCPDNSSMSDAGPWTAGATTGQQFGNRFVVRKSVFTNYNVCGTANNTPGVMMTWAEILRADGSVAWSQQRKDGQRADSVVAYTDTLTLSGFSISVAGNPVPFSYTQTTLGTFAPGVRPQLFPPTLPDAPVLPPPASDPVPLSPALPPPPDRRPLAPPVVIPRPGQQPARVPVPGPSPGPSPGPGPAPVPAQPAPLQVPGIGPLPLPAPLPVPVTPVEVVVVDGLPISGPGQAPAPNLVAIAQELGRLEKKNEILMRRPENGGLGEAAADSLLNGLRGLLEQLVGELLDGVGGGSFQLIRPCQAPGGGDPLPPVVVPYSGGTNATMAVLAKLDGIAGLIQAHKDVGQPTCVTPVFGEEVTVHFESE
jgi:hypothetical protein